MKFAAIIAFEGMFDSSLSVTLDILRCANQVSKGLGEESPPVEFGIYSASGDKIKTGGGLEINPVGMIEDLEDVDYVILPGIGISDSDQVAHILEQQDAVSLVDFIRRQHKKGAVISASCSASFFLAEAGVFDDNAATTSWWLADEFQRRYPLVQLQVDKMIVSGDDYLCAGAAMAQADLMMLIVSKLYGAKVARLVANYLLIDRREYQSQYIMSGLVSHKYPEVEKAEQWVRKNLSREFKISDLADSIGISERTLARRIQAALGLSPLKFVQQLRIESAIHLLETTNRSFDVIAYEVGYSDAASLRRLLQRHTGKLPGHFRSVRSNT